MSRELIVLVRCDVCREEREDTREEVVTLGRNKPLRLDLCSLCRTELLGPLEKVLGEYGVSPEAPAKNSPGKVTLDPYTCPLCTDYVGPTRKALAQHTRQVHDTGLTPLVAAGLLPSVPRGRAAAGEDSR